MSERPKFEPSLEYKNGTEIKQAQSKATEELRARLEPFKGVPYEIYDSSLQHKDKFNNHPIEGYPKYYLFLKEVDYLVQYALSREADAVVFFDKSARGFGLLANKILPVVALEKAIKEGRKPEEIKLPQILFYNAPQQSGQAHNDNAKKYFESLGLSKVVVFDESSLSLNLKSEDATFVSTDGSEPYRWKQAEIDPKDDSRLAKRIQPENMQTPESDKTTLLRITERLHADLPNTKFFPYSGGATTRGGTDLKTRKKINYQQISRDYNITDSRNQEDIFIKKLDSSNKFEQLLHISSAGKMSKDQLEEEIKSQRPQIRAEHSRMAWELFQQVILGKDPYKNSEF